MNSTVSMLHLKRYGILLILGAIGFIGARAASNAVTIEFIGLVHEDNPRVWAERPVIHQDPETCAECHEGMYRGWKSQAHQVVTCEDCHGSARDHIIQARFKQPALFPLADAKDLCLTCHLKIVGRPASFPVVEPAKHQDELPGATCTSCHTPHNPGYPPVFTHALEGRAICLNCHGKDEWKPVPPSHAERGGETCLRCHSQGEPEEDD